MDSNPENHPNPYLLKTKQHDGSSKKKYIAKKKLCAEMMANGIEPLIAIRTVFNVKDPQRKLKDLLKDEGMISMIRSEVASAAQELGLDHKRILEYFIEIIEKSKFDNVKLDALKSLANIVGTTAKEDDFGQVSAPVFASRSIEEAHDIEETKKLIGEIANG